MFATHPRSIDRPRGESGYADGTVHEAIDAVTWRLVDGRRARQAVSCLLTPQAGDRVLLYTADDGDTYLLHVLDRRDREQATLAAPGARQLSIRQEGVEVTAHGQITLRAGQRMEITVVRGALMLAARNLFASAAESIVHTAATYVGKVDQFMVSARKLLRLDAEQAMITARQDAKIDAERISLG